MNRERLGLLSFETKWSISSDFIKNQSTKVIDRLNQLSQGITYKAGPDLVRYLFIVSFSSPFIIKGSDSSFTRCLNIVFAVCDMQLTQRCTSLVTAFIFFEVVVAMGKIFRVFNISLTETVLPIPESQKAQRCTWLYSVLSCSHCHCHWNRS